MHARFCLTLRCNVALAVEFQPNAIMFEESGAAAGAASTSNSTAVTGQHHYTASAHDGGGAAAASGPGGAKPQATGRPSAVFGSPAPTGAGGIRTLTSGGLANGEGAGGGGRLAFSTARSGLDTTCNDAAWGASSGHVTASVLLHQIVGRRYKVGGAGGQGLGQRGRAGEGEGGSGRGRLGRGGGCGWAAGRGGEGPRA